MAPTAAPSSSAFGSVSGERSFRFNQLTAFNAQAGGLTIFPRWDLSTIKRGLQPTLQLNGMNTEHAPSWVRKIQEHPLGGAYSVLQ